MMSDHRPAVRVVGGRKCRFRLRARPPRVAVCVERFRAITNVGQQSKRKHAQKVRATGTLFGALWAATSPPLVPGSWPGGAGGGRPRRTGAAVSRDGRRDAQAVLRDGGHARRPSKVQQSRPNDRETRGPKHLPLFDNGRQLGAGYRLHGKRSTSPQQRSSGSGVQPPSSGQHSGQKV